MIFLFVLVEKGLYVLTFVVKLASQYYKCDCQRPRNSKSYPNKAGFVVFDEPFRYGGKCIIHMLHFYHVFKFHAASSIKRVRKLSQNAKCDKKGGVKEGKNTFST